MDYDKYIVDDREPQTTVDFDSMTLEELDAFIKKKHAEGLIKVANAKRLKEQTVQGQ